MADFIIAFDKTVKKEGGYDNDPDDKGNWTGKAIGKGVLAGTIMGITCWEVQEFLGRSITASDVKNFPLSSIQAIYKKKYWDVMRGDEIINQDNANQIFDFGVNVGINTGIKQWQRSLGVAETGKMDETTLKETNSEI
jgi:lysozyme family protein